MMNDKKRDQVLCRSILETLQNAHAAEHPKMAGTSLMDRVNDLVEIDRQFQDELHFRDLASRLEIAGFIKSTDGREYGREIKTLKRKLYELTPRGLDLLSEQIEPHILVADDRIVE